MLEIWNLLVVHICMCMYMCVCMCVCIHIYIYTYNIFFRVVLAATSNTLDYLPVCSVFWKKFCSNLCEFFSVLRYVSYSAFLHVLQGAWWPHTCICYNCWTFELNLHLWHVYVFNVNIVYSLTFISCSLIPVCDWCM
jgi:hypothetical protein